MNITGNVNGYFNIVEFFNSTSTNINTYNSSLCAVQRASNTGGSLLTYRPSDGIPAFTQFTPNSGYVVLASNNFILPEDQLQPTLASRSFRGTATGYFTIFKYNYSQSTNIGTFNSSLCAVQRASNTGGSILTYRPTDGIPAFTQFTPGSGYVILAKENFSIQDPSISYSGFDSADNYIPTGMLVTGSSSYPEINGTYARIDSTFTSYIKIMPSGKKYQIVLPPPYDSWYIEEEDSGFSYYTSFAPVTGNSEVVPTTGWSSTTGAENIVVTTLYTINS